MTKYTRIKTVLIVEDDVDIQQSLKLYLELLGLHSIEAHNGEHAIEILHTTEIDLLITDFRMPKMDGVHLLEWCRDHHFHLPVIFMSANANLIEREKVALADCCATLMLKPINIDIFTAAIEAADSRSHHANCIHLREDPVK